MSKKLDELRKQIDLVDDSIIHSFLQRQLLSKEIAEVKRKENLSITDPKREQEIIDKAIKNLDSTNAKNTASLLRTLISLSKSTQIEELGLATPLDIPKAAKPKPTAKVVYQGVPGSFSQIAAEKLYPKSTFSSVPYFEEVIETIKSKKAHYGILPIENSTAGAVGITYDLLKTYSAYIVGQVWIPVQHVLAGVKDTQENKIRTIYSHPQALEQCSRYFKGKNLELKETTNTAAAAKLVKDLNDPSVAAICSVSAAKLNGLTVLNKNINNDQKNKTRFIALSLTPEYDKTSDIVSIAFTTLHQPGALSKVLQSFQLANTNIRRIESRPSPSSDNFRFFVDFDGNILTDETKALIKEISALTVYLEFLGNYKDYS